jgi:ADP-heptose:LPS heptosyltransferase
MTKNPRQCMSATAALLLNVRAERAGIELSPPIRRIVTIHSGSLRELLLALPTVRAVREHFEGAQFTGVVREGLTPLLRASNLFDEVLARPEGGLSAHAHLMAKLRVQHYDIALAFSTSRNGTLLTFSSGAGVRVGFDGAKMDALLTHRIAREEAEAGDLFCINDYLDVARALGCSPRCQDYCQMLRPAIDDERAVADWLRDHNIVGDFILLWPQKDVRARRGALLPEAEIEHWARTAALLASRAPVVLGGARNNRALAARVEEYSEMKNLVVDAGNTFETGAWTSLCDKARLFVGRSSGAAHLAAAMGTSVVSICESSGAPHCDEPRGVPHRVLKSQAAPEEILEAAQELIGL